MSYTLALFSLPSTCSFAVIMGVRKVRICIYPLLCWLAEIFYGAFSHDVTAAILVFQNNETAAMLVYQENPLGVELFCHVNAFFWSNKLA